MNRKTIPYAFVLLLAAPALADFQIDRSVMSEKYWQIWNDAVQAKTNAKVEGEQRKVSFRGFRGRYRLSWKGSDGKEQFKLVEVK